MARRVCLTRRDLDIIREVGRSPLRTSQIGRLVGFSSSKKAGERSYALYQAGFVGRVPHFYLTGKRARPEFIYHAGGARPELRTLHHTLAVSEERVQVAELLRITPYTAEFYYGHELTTSSGLIPDAILLLHRGERTALLYFEVDRGTESVTGAGHSLASKLTAYARHFDSAAYEQDFPTEQLRGFRLAIIVPQGRVRNVERLLVQEHHDFVLLSTFDWVKEGLHGPVWLTLDGKRVNLLGRPGELVGEKIGASLPPPESGKS